MADQSTQVSDNESLQAQPSVSAQDEDAYLAARAKFAARRAYKRAARQARNPLHFSLWSLLLLAILAVLATALTIALVFALRGEPETPSLEAIIEVVKAPKDLAESDQIAESEALPTAAVRVILAVETPESLELEGPAIPTVVITNTPVPLSVGVQAAVYDVGNDQLNVRNIPSLTESQVLFRVDEGTLFSIIDGPQEADGFTWWQVRDAQYQVEGWAVANYLRTVSADTGQ